MAKRNEPKKALQFDSEECRAKMQRATELYAEVASLAVTISNATIEKDFATVRAEFPALWEARNEAEDLTREVHQAAVEAEMNFDMKRVMDEQKALLAKLQA